VRDPQIVEEELVEISAIQDDITKMERLLAWAAIHPDEVGFAVRFLSGRTTGLEAFIEKHQHHLPEGAT
jgi:hypothetical protein